MNSRLLLPLKTVTSLQTPSALLLIVRNSGHKGFELLTDHDFAIGVGRGTELK